MLQFVDCHGYCKCVVIATAFPLRYQVEKNETARENAWQLFKGMEFLNAVSDGLDCVCVCVQLALCCVASLSSPPSIPSFSLSFSHTHTHTHTPHTNTPHTYTHLLHQVTGVKGLMARSVVRSNVSVSGGVWHNSTTKLGWKWKGDTSSDEVCPS